MARHKKIERHREIERRRRRREKRLKMKARGLLPYNEGTASNINSGINKDQTFKEESLSEPNTP